MEEQLCQSYDLLRRLGVTANYKGFTYTAYALALCVEQPDLLLLVTKNLYPEVARRFGTTWQMVERDIRTVVGVAWARNPSLLNHMAGGLLCEKPRAARFLAIAAANLTQTEWEG